MKRTIIFILLIVLTAAAAGFAGAWHSANRDLEAAKQELKATNKFWLDEVNRNQSLQEEINRLRRELKVKEESWTYANQELQRALDQSTIVGKVYADQNYNQALDWRDHQVSGNIPGFKVVLYTTERKNDGPLNTVEVASTTVTDGEYRFTVGPGEYFIGVTYSSNQLYNRRYNHIIYIDGGDIIVGAGEIIIGPTILLADNGLG